MKKQVLLFSLLLFPFMGHAFKQVIDGIKYDLGGDKAKVVWYAEYEGDIIIPPTVEYGNITYTVNCIDRAFTSCDKVTSVTLPNTIVSITQYSLSGTSITSITIPESVTNLEEYVFQGCHSLETVVLPSTLGTIKKYTFDSCTALKEIEIPKTVTTIEERAFEGCSSLTSVVIPESVTTIGQLAFYESGLVSVAIMGKTTLGSSAFRSSVLDVYCFADTVLKAEHGTFTRDFIKMQSTLHVPAALVDAYKETDPWNYFKYVVPLKDGDPQSTGIDELHSQENSTKKTCYNLAGQKVNNPTKGLFVVEGKKIVVK